MENNKMNELQIGGLVKFSLLDYPEKLSAVVFTQGCNFKCSYCHNKHLISDNNSLLIKESEVLDFLEKRKSKLDGVVITGGEPCYQNYNSLYNFISNVKEIGYAVKLDTNGSFPDIIDKLIKVNLLDYIAMDIKLPLEYYDIVYNNNYTYIHNYSYDNIKKSIEIIRNFNNHEFRTTVFNINQTIDTVPKFDSNMIKSIMESIQGANKYILQTTDRSNKGISKLIKLYKETLEISSNFNIKDYFVRKY